MPVPPDLPQVVVEIAPPASPPELKSVLLDACTRAAEGAVCVEAGAAREDAPGVVAIVSWRDPGNVRLQVALRREQEWVAREIRFDEHDVPTERWRAVGLVIGTLGSVIARGEAPPQETPPAASAANAANAASAAGKPETAAEGEPPLGSPAPKRQTLAAPSSSSSPSPSPPVAAPKVRHRGTPRGWIDVAAVAGSAFLESPTLRLGAELGGSALLSRALFLSAHVGYSETAHRTRGVEASFGEASVGVGGVRDLGRHFSVAAELDGLCERFTTSVNSSGPETPTSGERWLGGARVAANWTWWGLDPVGLFLGSGFGWRAGTTAVEVNGVTAGTVPTFGYFVRAGASFGFR